MNVQEASSAAPDGAAHPYIRHTARALVCCVAFGALVVSAAVSAEAQELPFRTTYAGSAPHECPAWVPPARPERRDAQAARELASHATEAVVLGDLERASDLLMRAAELDGSDADIRYGHARVLESLDQPIQAIEAYCRVLALNEEESDLTRDAAQRKAALVAEVRDAIPFGARMSFERATGSAERGRFPDAVRYFSAAEAQAPGWSPALYNHGVALARAGRYREAAERLRRYLVLEPDAEDAVEVARRVGQLEATATPSVVATRSDAALTLGLVVPGLGQFSSGRSGAGLVVLSAAVGALATGLLVKEVNVRCLELPVGAASCPPDRVVSRRTERPLLGKSLVLAGTISLLGALEAWFRAPGAGDAATLARSTSAGEGVSLVPSVSVADAGRVDVRLLGLSIR